MLKQRIQEMLQQMGGQGEAQPQPSAEEMERLRNREQLYSLLCFVQQEITRTEQIFNLAEDDALIDNVIYTLKSLRAQQQFLVQNIRVLDGVGAQNISVKTDAPAEQPAAVEQQPDTVSSREGYAMG